MKHINPAGFRLPYPVKPFERPAVIGVGAWRTALVILPL
jgi:hypothetical protein